MLLPVWLSKDAVHEHALHGKVFLSVVQLDGDVFGLHGLQSCCRKERRHLIAREEVAEEVEENGTEQMRTCQTPIHASTLTLIHQPTRAPSLARSLTLVCRLLGGRGSRRPNAGPGGSAAGRGRTCRSRGGTPSRRGEGRPPRSRRRAPSAPRGGWRRG